MTAAKLNAKYGNTKAAHIVPKVYLESWSDDGLIGVHLVRENRDVVMPTSDAGTRRHLYRRERPGSAELIDDVENMLSQGEGRFGEILRDLGDRWPLSREDKWLVAEMLAYQLLRGPRWKTSFEAGGTRFAEELRQVGVHEIDGVMIPVPPAVYDQLEQTFSSDNQFRNNNTRFERMFTAAPTITSLLGSMQWTLLQFASPVIATCDHPVVLYPRTHHLLKPAPFVVTQIGLVEALEIHVPLGPTNALLMTWHDEPHSDGLHLGADRGIAMNLNAFTVAHADRQWFYRHDAKRPPRSAGLLPPIRKGLTSSS